MPSLATPAQLADYIRETPWTAGSPDERQAQQALDIASGIVRSRTGRDWATGSFTAYLPATDSQWLSLPADATVTAVTIDGAAVTDYTVVGERLFRYAGWLTSAYSPPVITVIYTTSGVVPDDVLGAVLAVAADIYENPRGLASESIDDYTWRASESEFGAQAGAALTAVAAAYRRRPLTVPLR